MNIGTAGRPYLLFLQQPGQCGVVLDSFEFPGHDLPDVGFYAVVILLYRLLHPVGTRIIREVGNDGYCACSEESLV